MRRACVARWEYATHARTRARARASACACGGKLECGERGWWKSKREGEGQSRFLRDRGTKKGEYGSKRDETSLRGRGMEESERDIRARIEETRENERAQDRAREGGGEGSRKRDTCE